jgi:SAM-dependent methyltransferase
MNDRRGGDQLNRNAVNGERRAQPPGAKSVPEGRDPRTGPKITEDAFDRVFPEAIHRCSGRFWTPVEVARRAAAFLAPCPSARVLDVGSGVGKFCIVGALATGASFSGIEHRPHLVAIANRASRELGAARTEFAVGTIEDVDWSLYDGFYFFNPFEENVWTQDCFDRSVVLSEERFWNDLAFVEWVLALAPVGTRVATFHGFGGRIPPTYQLVDQQPHRGGILRFWTKVSAAQTFEGGILEALMPLPALPFENFSVEESCSESGTPRGSEALSRGE